MNSSALELAVSQHVQASLTDLDRDLSLQEKNPRIDRVLRSTVLSGGKRLRPLVTYLWADLFGVDHATITPFAKVAEFTHAATLAHDDVIDNADTRRGVPSINIVASNKKAVLAGDYLLAHSLQIVADFGNNVLVKALAQTISDLAEGEWLQIENTFNTKLKRADIDRVALKKTGSVLRWCCQAAPLFLGLEPEVTDKVKEFGEKLGLAFQMSDDVLDFKRRDGSEYADLKNKLMNSVIYEAWQQEKQAETIDANECLNKSFPDKHLNTAIERVQKRTRLLLDECRQILNNLSESLMQRSDELRNKTTQRATHSLNIIIDILEHRV